MYSGIGSGLLGLEMPLHPQQQPQASQNPQSLHLHHQSHQLSAFGAHNGGGGDQSGKHSSSYAFASNPKPTTPNSDEDEAGGGGDGGGGDPKRKMSPWQRMKWTDNMVRLLIMAVYYIGDEVGSESSDPAGKKKPPGGGGLLQKKGKWKSVSRAMMEKGFFVSPQQCEDKFNDLNKRYKRVNDILGRGTACRVVENQTLLETMEIPPKMKEEARKLLNSKHLFFREMCAYHNSCGHGTGTPPPPPPPAGPAEIAANEPPSPHLQQQAQPLCYHTSDAVNSCRNEGEAVKLIKAGSDEEDEEENDDDNDDDDEESEDESEDEDMEDATDQCRGHGGHENDDNNDDNNNNESHSHSSQKRQRKAVSMTSSLMGQLSSEVGSMMQDGAKSEWEKKQWVRMRLRQLEEQQVKYEYQALELEKQRLKWIKFSSKKEREMEKAKLENQRRRLETERMALFVRHKEMELLDHHHQINNNNRRADPSTITGYENRIE